MTRSLLRTIAALALFALAPFGRGTEPSPGAPTILRDLEYARVGEQALQLDLYLPSCAAKPFPLIVWIHGGAWRAGSKADMPLGPLVAQGFAVASVDYRLSTDAPFPAQAHDLKAALRFLAARWPGYHYDPTCMAIAGASAGGHLAALVGVTNDDKQLAGEVGEHLRHAGKVRAIVSFFGASNLQTILAQSTPHGLSVRVPALQLLLGGQPDEKRELARLASPVAHVDAGDPPLFLLHGDADPQMPIEQSRELRAAYERAGLPVRFEVVDGGKHGGPEFYEPARLRRVGDFLREALK